MENRYLFRAKRIDNGEWVEGFYFCMTHPDGRHIHHFIIPLGADLSLGTAIEKIQVEIDQSTICQCTGLKDKNGKLVWENDILLQKTTEKHWCKWQCMGVVKYGIHDWNCGNYGYQSIGFYVESIVRERDEIRMSEGLCQEYLVDEAYPYEVIGSVIDNPELLEV